MNLSRTLKITLCLALLGAAFYALLYYRHHRPQADVIATALPVTAATVASADVPVFIDALGAVTATRTVNVTTQVSGILQAMLVKEGQQVQRGQIIAKIDDRALQAQLAQAQGTLEHDRALLANARLDLQRFQGLVQAGSVTQQTLDTQSATVHANTGTVAADQGNVDYLKVQLAYCTIVSPVDGIIGLRQIDPGNYVSSTSATAIAVITQLQPATVVFAIAEDALGQLRQAQQHGVVPVLALDRNKRVQLASGTLLAVDNQVDASTGTIKVKAEFAHAGDTLFPNQFVNVRMQVDTLQGITVVPGAAVQHGANGDFVFTIDADNRVQLHNIKTGPASGDLVSVLDATVTVGQRVVVDGADKLDDGARVNLVTR